ncbi:uncharacterized protein H6S33_006198 [Morchella sextelata]|uniref:uncharacterized protein n=1 Tax=Morchella sextelata TaxID=1174677 RepID=UPI001D043C35|nr:uncharacterized protein H6S33_006198 [Morchella sextelata]KAH0614312.1 hypothetical protein H6S33_006198 [Morchella sextelata]
MISAMGRVKPRRHVRRYVPSSIEGSAVVYITTIRKRTHCDPVTQMRNSLATLHIGLNRWSGPRSIAARGPFPDASVGLHGEKRAAAQKETKQNKTKQTTQKKSDKTKQNNLHILKHPLQKLLSHCRKHPAALPGSRRNDGETPCWQPQG